MRTPGSMLFLAMSCVLAGCAMFGNLSSVAVGDDEAAVSKQLGRPADVRRAPNGDVVWQYPRGPRGFTTDMVTFGPDGKVKSTVQALTEANFRNIQPGQTKADILLLLGRPRSELPLPNLAVEVWDYGYATGTFDFNILDVYFGPDGRVKYYSTAADEANSAGD